MDKQTLKVLEGQVASIIETHVLLIAVDAKSLADARERAGKFLIAQSILSTFLKNFEEDLARSATLTSVTYAQGIAAIEGSKITEKKVQVANDKNYTNAREMEEQLDAFKNWIKVHMKIFENAHLMYRQFGKE